MQNQTVSVTPGMFRSALIPVAAVLCALAALLGLPGVVLLFSPDYADFLVRDMVAGGISSAQVLQTWQIINSAVTLIGCVCPGVMAVGLLITLGGKPARGMGMLSNAAQWLRYGVTGAGVIVLCVFVFKFVRYVIVCLGANEGLYLIYAMVISEGLMFVLAWFLFKLTRRFLDCACDSAASIAYTLSTGKLDTVSIPGFTATGFLILSVFCVAYALNQIFTVTIVENYIQSYYKLLVAAHPAQYAAAASFLCSAAASVLLFVCLRRYKRSCERALFDSRKRIKSQMH